MRLFAPLYLSNECVNICKYCGFSRDNPDPARHPHARAGGGRGAPSLRAGLSQRAARRGRTSQIRRARLPRPVASSAWGNSFPPSRLKSGRWKRPTTNRSSARVRRGSSFIRKPTSATTYAELHTAGPKKNFDWRLDCPERAYAAGFRRLGIGALFGLAPWEGEALALAAHVDYLLRHCWKASLTVSLPRLRPAAGEFEPRHEFSTIARWCRSSSRCGFAFRRSALFFRRAKPRHCATGWFASASP